MLSLCTCTTQQDIHTSSLGWRGHTHNTHSVAVNPSDNKEAILMWEQQRTNFAISNVLKSLELQCGV